MWLQHGTDISPSIFAKLGVMMPELSVLKLGGLQPPQKTPFGLTWVPWLSDEPWARLHRLRDCEITGIDFRWTRLGTAADTEDETLAHLAKSLSDFVNALLTSAPVLHRLNLGMATTCLLWGIYTHIDIDIYT